MKAQVFNGIERAIEREIDPQSGEIINVRESEKEVFGVSPEPRYVKLYIDDLCLLTAVPSALKNVLLMLLHKLDYDGYVTLSKRYRLSICKELNVTEKTLRNRLNELVSKKLLVNEGINEYLINPNYFARGKWRDVLEQRKNFQLRITYSSKGRTVETVVINDGDSHLQQEIPITQ